MEDVELILRFFALRNAGRFSGNLKDFLDFYMRKSLNFSEEDIEMLKEIFLETIALAGEIYEEHLFKPFDPQSGTWKKHSSKAYYDAVMVGLSDRLSQANLLVERKSEVIEETKKLFKGDKELLLGRDAESQSDAIARIKLFDDMLSQFAGK